MLERSTPVPYWPVINCVGKADNVALTGRAAHGGLFWLPIDAVDRMGA
jgi:hypothetical protein